MKTKRINWDALRTRWCTVHRSTTNVDPCSFASERTVGFCLDISRIMGRPLTSDLRGFKWKKATLKLYSPQWYIRPSATEGITHKDKGTAEAESRGTKRASQPWYDDPCHLPLDEKYSHEFASQITRATLLTKAS